MCFNRMIRDYAQENHMLAIARPCQLRDGQILEYILTILFGAINRERRRIEGKKGTLENEEKRQ